ncbi:MAG: nitroreductase/quinone reductase family protein, partial [Planctomycetota bacterium]
MQKFASSRFGAWYFSRTQHYFDRGFLKLTNGRVTMTSILSGLPVAMLTTTGAKSGLSRTLPLLCIRDSRLFHREASQCVASCGLPVRVLPLRH